MNRRQKKKDFRKHVSVFPIGRRTKAKTWAKATTRRDEKFLLAAGVIERMDLRWK